MNSVRFSAIQSVGYLVKQLMGDRTVFARAATERKDLDTVQVRVDMGADFEFPLGLRVDVKIEIKRRD